MATTEHTKPKHRFWRGTVFPRLALMVVPLPKRTFCSIDVTAKCNLRCTHCYHFSQEQPKVPELTTDEWLMRIHAMQSKKPYFNCTWVGGEPLLRPELIEQGRRHFRSNRVVTNGTIELPHWTDVEFHVSVDGTEELHDELRGAGCYAMIKKNFENLHYKDLNIALACCLNRKNVHCIAELVGEWREVGVVRHILFDFYTPVRGKDDPLWLTFSERDNVLRTLKILKKRHGDFIGGPPATFDLMLAKNAHKSVGKNCVCVKNGVAFDAWGNRKKPCVMGSNVDCARCGCIVPFSVRAWKKPSNLLREIVQGGRR